MIRSERLHRKKGENPSVFLSLVKEAFRRYTNTDPESSEGRTFLAIHFVTQATPDAGENYKSLRLGPKPHCKPW